MGIEQSVLGKAILVFGSVAFVYYSVWVLSAPFIAEGSALERAFPPKALATAVPIYAGLLLLSIIVFNVGWSLVSAHPVFQRSKNKEWHEKNS